MTETTATETRYFSGDWEWNDTLDAYETAFAALRFGEPWNGFARPVVTPSVMDAIVARETLLRACGETVDFMQWDGNGVRVVSSDAESVLDDDEATWILPDDDGNFDLGVLGYTFETLDDDDNVIRRVGSRDE